MTSLTLPFRALSLALVLTALAGCGHSGDSAGNPKPSPSATAKVATITAQSATLTPTEQLAGIIAPFQNVTLESTLTEPADIVAVQEGDTVQTGQLLAQLNTADLEANLQADLAQARSNSASTDRTTFQGQLAIAQGRDASKSAQASVAQAQANLRRDQADLARYQSLFQGGYVSAQQLTASTTTVRNDEQALRTAQADLSSAQSNVQANGSISSRGLQSATIEQTRATVAQAEAQAEQVRVQIRKARIVSPITGVVVNRNLNPGEYPGTRQIFTLQQINPIFAILRGSGSQIAPIHNGLQATVTVPDLRNLQTSGTVVGVLNQVTPGSTDFQVKIRLDNPTGRIRPGMSVSGKILLPEVKGLRVPLTAFTDVRHLSIQVMHSDGTLHEQNIQNHGENATYAVITGIAPGTRVARDGQIQSTSDQKAASE